jgi:hypothetical protein
MSLTATAIRNTCYFSQIMPIYSPCHPLREFGEMGSLETMPQGRLCWGARAIAEVLFGPEDAKSQWHKVYSLKHELPIFSMGSNLVAYENQLREVMAGKAAKALEHVMETRAM